MTHPTYRTFEPCRNWDVVRTWGRETNRSGQLPALEADGGRDRRAIGDRSSGGPPSPAPRRGTFCPLVGCTSRAAGSGTRHRASPPGRGRRRMRVTASGQVRIRSRIRSMCSIFPSRRGGVSRVPLPEHLCRVCSGCGLQKSQSDVLRELSRRTTCSKTRSLRASRPPKGWARTPCPTCACRTLRAGHLP